VYYSVLMTNIRKRRIPILCVMALLAYATGHVGAFGEAGHRVVGSIAELHLRDSRALQEVRRILRPQETLADAAVWADTIKNVMYEDEDSGLFRLEHPQHEVYHYTDLAFQADWYDADALGAHSGDVVRMAVECIRVLKRPPSMPTGPYSRAFTPREALRLLAHFVGDMHQPLHIGSAYVSADEPLRFVVPTGATGWRMAIGGNALRYGPQDTLNLHSYWDSRAVSLSMAGEDVAAYSARLVREVPIPPIWKAETREDTWPIQWATDALVYAKDVHRDVKVVAYLGPDAERRVAHRWRIELPPDYDDRARQLTRNQLAKGGYRLAATLKAIWPDGH
jgi:hypothetical protein